MVEPHWTDTAHLFRDCYINSINIENRQDLNDAEVPTEESRIESPTANTEETPNERAGEERSQSDDNEHETHQVEPRSKKWEGERTVVGAGIVTSQDGFRCEL